MALRYSEERNIQMIVYLMKQYGIHNVIVCPGAGNITFVATIQTDPFFHLWSVIDERSAVYMACGLAQETGEPVCVSVTCNAAVRNAIPGMTEAYYRNLPILLCSFSYNFNNIGNYWPQVLDESVWPNDAQKFTVGIPTILNPEEEWKAGVNLNRALCHLLHQNGGPVHIVCETRFNKNYREGVLPEAPVIEVCTQGDSLPALSGGPVGIYAGNHKKWSDVLTEEVDRFCELYDAVVICDNTSNYHGKYGINPSIVWNQQKVEPEMKRFDVIIHIGSISGSYIIPKANRVWRVDRDGAIRDAFMKLSHVFEMEEAEFFRAYNEKAMTKPVGEMKFYGKWSNAVHELRKRVPKLPLSNAWIAQQSSMLLPEGSAVYFAILNTLRCWNLFELAPGVDGYSNTGAFGIDGGLSTLMGMSFANPEKLYFGIFGDLGFFYDMNALGNRHLNHNVRILVVNNGIGTEFKTYKHFAEELGDEVDSFIAAQGHFNSPVLLKHYAQDLGMEYFSAASKEEFLKVYSSFFSAQAREKPLLFEVFTKSSDETEALKRMYNIL